MKYIALVLVLVLAFAVALPTQAAFCRTVNGHNICILSIKRSAKNYWEYRASVSIDGIARPIEVYNCRDRQRIQKDGTVTPFVENGPGELICSVLK
ncbi:hypothetical protein H6F88_14750 [Oculatella sp. FACHB-28]|uniref:hypothetical protein n=1 Tax=Oculatella sp. FACHB-28 TaxID=2692845 RepID=UPI00168755FE|nr:hypothetical protein [Oculatella sp. FACHB-28]MBD2057263.1 hypothetical protein [Oculatella sp. FACHB-28]